MSGVVTQKSKNLSGKIQEAYQNKSYKECLKLIEESESVDPSNISHKILQTYCWTSLNINKAETNARLKKIIEDDPKNSFAYYGLGFAHYCNGELMESVEYLKRAIELNPTGVMQKAVELKQKATNVMEAICDANSKFERNDVEKALKVLSAALFIDPENTNIRQNILNIRKFFVKDLVERLETEVNRDVQKVYFQDQIDKKVKIAEALIKAENLGEAQKLIEEISKLDSKSCEIAYLKGFALYMTGALKEAAPLLSEALKLNHSHLKAMELLAKATNLMELINSAATKMVEKNHAESIELLTKALAVDKSNSKINQAAYFQRAMAHFSQGNSAEAYSDFKKFEGFQTEASSLVQN